MAGKLWDLPNVGSVESNQGLRGPKGNLSKVFPVKSSDFVGEIVLVSKVGLEQNDLNLRGVKSQLDVNESDRK